MNLLKTFTNRVIKAPYKQILKLSYRSYAKQSSFVEFTDNQEFKQFLETGVQKKKINRKLTEDEIKKFIQNFNIPDTELLIKYSRSSGPGGQHVNRTESKATVSFNIYKSSILDKNAKDLLIENLRNKLTKNGDLMTSCQETREQKKNLEIALYNLKKIIAENMGSEVIEDIELLKEEAESREIRLQKKKKRSDIKKMRTKKFDF